VSAGQDIGRRTRVLARNIGQASAPGTMNIGNNGFMIDFVLFKDARVPAKFARVSRRYRDDALLIGGRESNTRTLAPRASKMYPRYK